MCEVDDSAIAGPPSDQVNDRTRQMHDQSDDFSHKLLLATNQMLLCSADGLEEDSQHELVVKAPSDINTRLVFDYLVFATEGYEGYYQSAYPGTYLLEANNVTVLGEWQPSTGSTVEEEPNSLYRNSIIAGHNASISLHFYGTANFVLTFR